MSWTIWGDVTDPIRVGLTEKEARTFLLDISDDTEMKKEIYAENESGDQIETHDGPVILNER